MEPGSTAPHLSQEPQGDLPGLTWSNPRTAHPRYISELRESIPAEQKPQDGSLSVSCMIQSWRGAGKRDIEAEKVLKRDS